MKGFIEVEIQTGWNEYNHKRDFVISVDNILAVDGWRIHLKQPIKITYSPEILNKKGIDRYVIETSSTYNEIKQKIKEAQGEK